MDTQKEKISLTADDLKGGYYDYDIEETHEESYEETDRSTVQDLFDSVFDAVASLDPNESIEKTGRSKTRKENRMKDLADLGRAAKAAAVNTAAAGMAAVNAASEKQKEKAARKKEQEENQSAPALEKRVIKKSPRVARQTRASRFTIGRVIKWACVITLIFYGYQGLVKVNSAVSSFGQAGSSIAASIKDKISSLAGKLPSVDEIVPEEIVQEQPEWFTPEAGEQESVPDYSKPQEPAAIPQPEVPETAQPDYGTDEPDKTTDFNPEEWIEQINPDRVRDYFNQITGGRNPFRY